MDTRARIALTPGVIAEFCRRNGIAKLSLFGSVLRNDFDEDSDVDMLVEFVPGTPLGFAIVGMEMELSGMVGRKVDLRTPEELSRYFRQRVLDEAELLYVRG